jgi:amino acid adenylation domain-containing protein
MLNYIQESCTQFADKTAFVIENNSYTYSDFAVKVSAVRNQLEKFGGKELKLVGVETYNDIDTYTSIFGILFSGNGFVPLNPTNPPDRNLSVIEQSDLKVILTSNKDSEISKLANSSNIKVITSEELTFGEINLSLPDVSENEIAYILFTSGSTGIPKGVPITRKNLTAFIDAFYALGYKVDENDRFMQMFELTFDFSIFTYIAPLCKGASIHTLPSGGIKYANVYTILEEQEITFAAMVPSILAYLRPYFEEITFDKLKYSLFCGEALVKDIVTEWQKCTPNSTIVNAYGPTEATVFCLIYNCSKESKDIKEHNDAVSIGKEMKNTKAIVVDEYLKILPAGEKGELCLSGSQVTPGYWRNDEKNKESFFKAIINDKEEIFYRTGDLAYIDAQGDFMFLGRLDYQVKVDGFRIELGEIEHHVRQHTNLTNVVAAPINNKVGTAEIHLFMENFNGDSNELAKKLKEKIPHYMIPSYFHSVPAFPLNANGKVDRKALINNYSNI